MVASASITVIFLIVMAYLMGTYQLMPDFMILGSLILFALWLTGLIETGIQMFSAAPNVNSNCINFVYHRVYKGPSAYTLAWLEQVNICNCWRALFSFELIACVIICAMFCLSIHVRNHRRVAV
ncbi:hypothetical protein KEM52_006622 [Ascosphaera acerosa]|nr:hypothetical protein KEM52_006622 [Ascosphaera acerosa]